MNISHAERIFSDFKSSKISGILLFERFKYTVQFSKHKEKKQQ